MIINASKIFTIVIYVYNLMNRRLDIIGTNIGYYIEGHFLPILGLILIPGTSDHTFLSVNLIFQQSMHFK